MSMTLEQLKALHSIVENGSLASAAKALNKTQPTISIAIKKLEEDLGVELFVRNQYRKRLTPIGEIMFKKASLILAQTKSFELLGKQLASGQEVEIGLAYGSALPLDLILEIVEKCKSKYPATCISLYAETVKGSLDRLQDDQASMIIMPGEKLSKNLESYPFYNLQFIMVTGSQSKLAQSSQPIFMEDIANFPQVVVTDGSRSSPNEYYGVADGGNWWKVDSYREKKELILRNMGWGGLPKNMIEVELQQGLLLPIKVEGIWDSMDVPMYMARVANNPAGPVASYLWELLLDNRTCSKIA